MNFGKCTLTGLIPKTGKGAGIVIISPSDKVYNFAFKLDFEASNNVAEYGYSWILTTTDYFTKWLEAIPTKKATDAIVMDFLEDKIITRFGVPARIIMDNGPCFVSSEMSSFCFKYGIVLSHSSNYYPQGNGLA